VVTPGATFSGKLALACAAAALAMSCDAGAVDHWRVAAALLHDGRQFAKASAVVAADRPATIEVDGKAGYSLTLGIEEIGRGRLRLNAILVSAYGSMSPAVVLRPGQTANIAIDHVGLVLKVRRVGEQLPERSAAP
jgi:hypothetical protein